MPEVVRVRRALCSFGAVTATEQAFNTSALAPTCQMAGELTARSCPAGIDGADFGQTSRRPAEVLRPTTGRDRRLAAHETVVVRENDDLDPVPQIQFAKDGTDVGLHGRLAGEQRRGDLGVRPASGYLVEDVPLAVGE